MRLLMGGRKISEDSLNDGELVRYSMFGTPNESGFKWKSVSIFGV